MTHPGGAVQGEKSLCRLEGVHNKKSCNGRKIQEVLK